MAVPWWGLIPFVLMLLAIAIFPLWGPAARRWESRRFQLAIALLLGLPVAGWVAVSEGPLAVGHTVVEYLQFLCLLLCLFVVAGGIHLAGDIEATPRNNTIFLAIGGLLASFIGTTGATLLLLRPILSSNRERTRTTHTIVFVILVIANCGGVLTPLGDPPLFLGMLRGVPFAWTLRLIPEWVFTVGLLLVSYYLLDRREHAREPSSAIEWDHTDVSPIRVHGKGQFAWFAVIIAAVALLPSLDLHAIEAGHAAWHQYVPWRELVMLGAAGASLALGDRETRYVENGFEWGPIVEVAVLFIGIFLTMMPALRYLAQVAPRLPLDEVTFFAFSGSLSSVLDNAPTYATFFEMAKALPGSTTVAGVPEHYLVAISLGSVFCGAMTYIGNGPNFMVKAVAESAGVTMPHFGGYIVWTLTYLLPILVAMVLIFLVSTPLAIGLGILVAALVVGRGIWQARSGSSSVDA